LHLEPDLRDALPSDRTAEEARFWDERQTADAPDHRLRRRAASPQELWDDPEIEAITRGRYVDRILADCSTPGLAILELACGCGWLSLELARRGHHVHGIDLSPERIRSASEYAAVIREKETGLGRLSHEVSDLNRIELPSRRYDRVVCWDGLHHIEEIERLAAQIHRTLRPGGRLLVFDHIGPAGQPQRRMDEALALLTVMICHPADLARLVRSRKHVHRAPSEDVTGAEMVTVITRAFGAHRVRVETVLALGKRWLARLRGPRTLRLAFTRAFCRWDRTMIRARILQGEYIYIEAARDPLD
jgi:2-polyprenyl-3-methyl-5-hydroxy-6-metoxy-1,4-benzoquinol methylase